MDMFYSASTGGFYSVEIHGEAIPEDAKPISDALYWKCAGQAIEPDAQGLPRLIGSVPPTAAKKRERLKHAVTAKRWEVETGGITLPNGVQLDTGREDQAAVSNAIAVWPFTGLDTISFKAASGFVTLDFDTLQQIAAAIGLHKQACYAAERAHYDAIDATAAAQLNGYDITTGWPA